MRQSSRACAAILVCGLAVAPRAASPQTESIHCLDGTTISMVDAEAFARKTLDDAHVTGAQIAVLDCGRLVWSAAFGLRRLDPKLAMDRETTLWAASITKSVFAVYVMQLVERREFDLDIPVAKQLAKPLDQCDEYKDKASEIVRDPAWLRVTPRMLLSHSSGLRNFVSNGPDKKLHLHFAPGTQFLYSGEGINLVQFVIEQQKRRPLEELMHEALFQPLGMTRTGLIYRTEFADDVADRYDATGKFLAKTQRSPARGAGSMTTSAEDVARLVEALFADRILKPATMAEMLRPVLPIRTEHEFGLTEEEGLGAEVARAGLAYGVGWGLLTTTKYGPAFFKEGHGDGAQNYMICFERRRVCMILLTNSDNSELVFRPPLEKILGDTVTPWEWEGYTPGYILASRKLP